MIRPEGSWTSGSEVVTEIQVRDQVDKCMRRAAGSPLDTERTKLEDTGWNAWRRELEGHLGRLWVSGSTALQQSTRLETPDKRLRGESDVCEAENTNYFWNFALMHHL